MSFQPVRERGHRIGDDRGGSVRDRPHGRPAVGEQGVEVPLDIDRILGRDGEPRRDDVAAGAVDDLQRAAIEERAIGARDELLQRRRADVHIRQVRGRPGEAVVRCDRQVRRVLGQLAVDIETPVGVHVFAGVEHALGGPVSGREVDDVLVSVLAGLAGHRVLGGVAIRSDVALVVAAVGEVDDEAVAVLVLGVGAAGGNRIARGQPFLEVGHVQLDVLNDPAHHQVGRGQAVPEAPFAGVVQRVRPVVGRG